MCVERVEGKTCVEEGLFVCETVKVFRVASGIASGRVERSAESFGHQRERRVASADNRDRHGIEQGEQGGKSFTDSGAGRGEGKSCLRLSVERHLQMF